MTAEEKIEALVRKLYGCISFEPGGKPDFDTLRTIFFDGARLINNSGEKPSVVTVEGYIERFGGAVEAGRIPSFQEKEVASRTERFGKIAQRFSTYESRHRVGDPESFDAGINSVQMMEVDGEWLVTSLIWNNESDGRVIPEEYRQAA